MLCMLSVLNTQFTLDCLLGIEVVIRAYSQNRCSYFNTVSNLWNTKYKLIMSVAGYPLAMIQFCNKIITVIFLFIGIKGMDRYLIYCVDYYYALLFQILA